MIGPELVEAIREDAMKRYPSESCGVVLEKDDGELVYVAMDNVADDPEKSYRMEERKLVPIMDRIKIVVHSHPDGPDCPSKADMETQQRWAKPFGIISTDGQDCLPPFFWGADWPRAPLIGRSYRYGVTDCYSLIRDYYDEKLGIKLRDYPRDWEWWNNGGRMYEEFFENEGFKRIDVSQVKEHDCFLAQIRSPTMNHGGVYVGQSLILHHLSSAKPADLSRLSRRDPIGSWSRFINNFWVRHESLF